MSRPDFNALQPGQSPVRRERPPPGWILTEPHTSPVQKHQPGTVAGGPSRFLGASGLGSPVRAFDLAGATPLVGADDGAGLHAASDGVREMASRGLGRSRSRVLDLSRIELGVQEVQHWAERAPCMASLRKLALVCCALRGEDMRAFCAGLAGLPRLRELELGRNRLLDFGVEHLAKALPQLSRLEWLGLGENGIGPSGARALGGGGFWEGGLQVGHGVGLPAMASLTKLEMVKNRVGDEGAKHLAAAITRSDTLTTLTWIGLDANRLEDEGCVCLLRACTSLPALQLLGLGKSPEHVDFDTHLGRALPAVTQARGWAACVNYLRYFDEVWSRYPGLLSPSQVALNGVSERERARERECV